MIPGQFADPTHLAGLNGLNHVGQILVIFLQFRLVNGLKAIIITLYILVD